jgi:DNA-directed RNA polymerase specialized sigma subunit
VAAILGITKAQVTHAEQMALKKLRIALEEQGYPHEADFS